MCVCVCVCVCFVHLLIWIINFTKTWYHTQFQDAKLCDASVAPTSQIRASAMLLLLLVIGY